MLDQMTARLAGKRKFEDAAIGILDDVIALHGAEFGDLQLLSGEELVIVAQRGLPADFLEVFLRVDCADGTACGRALRGRQPVVISDVETDPEYIEFRAIAHVAGYRSVQSTPLVTSSGKVIGIVSTLFTGVHEPTPIEMETLAQYSIAAADRLTRLLANQPLGTKAEAMSARMLAKARKAAARNEWSRRAEPGA
jgi:GAF domain-containing protein